MIAMAAMRRLCPWVVGLFLIAQVFGVVPLVSGHTAHVAEAELVLSKDSTSTGSIPHQGHHHVGDADGFIQHHELQDLNCAFTSVVCCEIAFVHVAITAPAPSVLAEADRILLERPPKPLLSI
jgi:hypothetical protein